MSADRRIHCCTADEEEWRTRKFATTPQFHTIFQPTPSAITFLFVH